MINIEFCDTPVLVEKFCVKKRKFVRNKNLSCAQFIFIFSLGYIGKLAGFTLHRERC